MFNVKLFDYRNKELKVKFWKFPAGEVGVKIEEEVWEGNITVALYSADSDSIMAALNLCDALKRQGIPKRYITLYAPYLPYARQDRACASGESFALEVMLKILETAYCSQVNTLDVHSNVVFTASQEKSLLIENLEQYYCAEELPNFQYLIAPDKGAAEKVGKHFQVRDGKAMAITLYKYREGSQVVYNPCTYTTLVGTACVVDDICDGGATFISLAKMLKQYQPGLQLNLYVTHGIFSKGLDELKQYYKTIYVQNCMNLSVASDAQLVQLPRL